MIGRFLALLSGLKARLLVAGLALAGVAGLILKSFFAGQAAARAAADKATLEAMRHRREIDNEVEAMGHADLDREYDRWLRNKE